MSFTVQNLDLLVTPSQTANPWVQLYFDLNNSSGSDLDQTIFVRYFYGTGHTDRQYRFTVADGQTERILTPRTPLADPDTITSVRFELPGGNVSLTDANYQVTDYTPGITIDQHELGLYPTRIDRPDGMPSPLPSGWFGDFSLNVQSTFLEEVQLVSVNYIYDDGTELNRGPYYVEENVLRPGFAIPTQGNSTYSIDRMGTANQGDFPLIIARDKQVIRIVILLEPGDTLNQRIDERFEVVLDPANVQLHYTPMTAQITTSGNSIFVTVSGGVEPYDYFWQDGSTEQNRLNIPPGLYTLVVTDAIGEKATFSAQLGDLHYFSENPVTLAAKANNVAEKPFLRMICQVWYEKDYLSDTYEQLFEAEQPINGQGETQFDVRNILDTVLTPQLPVENIQRQTEQFKRFYLRFFERYGDPEQNGSFTQVQESYLLLGGLSKQEYARGNFFGNYFQNGPFYTWQPRSKTIYPDQPEYLTFVVNSFDYTAFEVLARLYYIAEDGTETSQEITLFTQSDVKKYEVYCFPVGPNQLYLSGYNCQQLDRYMIYCQSAGPPGGENVVSEEREYILDYRANPYSRYFLFQNSLGGWDTLVTSGRAEQRVSITTQALQRYLPPEHSPLEPESDILSRTATPETRLSAGYQSREMMQAAQDFLVSKMVYLVGGVRLRRMGVRLRRITPIEIDVRSVTVDDEDENLQSFSFSYQPPRFDRYTPALESPASEAIQLSVQLVGVTDEDEGQANGAIDIQVQGGTEPYTFLWEDGNTDSDRTGLEAGTYGVSVRDSSVPIRQAVSLCGIEVSLIPRVNEVSGTIRPQWIAQTNLIYSTGPAYVFQGFDSSPAGFDGIVLYDDVQFIHPVNVLEGWIYLPSAEPRGGPPPENFDYTSSTTNQQSPIQDDSGTSNPIYFHSAFFTQIIVTHAADASIRDQWQRIRCEFQGQATQSVKLGIGVQYNGSDAPFYLSDLNLSEQL